MSRKHRIQAILQLAGNDMRARYAGSLFGVLWAFVMPLVTILVFWYVFQKGFRNPPVAHVPYMLWFTAAYVPWIFFVDLTTFGCNSLVEYSFLVKKIKFEVELIPVMKLLSALFVHAFFVAVLYGMYLIYGYSPSVFHLQLLYYTFAASAFGLGLVWLLSAVTVFFQDLNSLYAVVLQIGFWVTPILWDEETMVDLSVRQVLSLNPMHYIVNGYRESLWYHRWFWEAGAEGLRFWGTTAVLWLLGGVVFRRLRPFFADEV